MLRQRPLPSGGRRLTALEQGGAAAAAAGLPFPPRQAGRLGPGKELGPEPSPALGPEVPCRFGSLGDRDTVKYARHAAPAEHHAKEGLRVWLLPPPPSAAVGLGNAHR